MGSVNEMLKNVPIPKVVKIRQKFNNSFIENIEKELLDELSQDKIIELIKPGMSIAITAGSRGIANIDIILKGIVQFLKSKGANPFIIPAMGSHGGSTAEGQKDILNEYNITEEFIGCPIKATMQVQKIGELEDGRPILIDEYASKADGIIAVNRIKPHTSFKGRFESGIMKILAVGLGKQAGAEICHRDGILALGRNIEKFSLGILANANILFGVGIVENAYDYTHLIKVMTKKEIPIEEPRLLEIARINMPCIKFKNVDVLIVDEIGKNISGEGMDPNIVGRWVVPSIKGGINATRVGVLDITKESLGNSVGLGMADVCSKTAVDKIDTDNTYPNSLTSTVTRLSAIPMYFSNHMNTIKAAIKMVPRKDLEDITLIRIKNTLEMEYIYISENLIDLAKQDPTIKILGGLQELMFNENGNLF